MPVLAVALLIFAAGGALLRPAYSRVGALVGVAAIFAVGVLLWLL